MTASAYNAITSQLCPKAAALSEKNFSLSEKQTMQYELIIDRRTLRHREPICAMGWPKLRQGVVLSNARARLLSAQFAIGVLAQNSFMARANAMIALIPPQTLAEAAIRHWRNPGIAWRSSRHFAHIAAADLLVYRIRLFSIATEIDTLPRSGFSILLTLFRLASRRVCCLTGRLPDSVLECSGHRRILSESAAETIDINSLNRTG
ncbi:MAG: hypothetical protein OXG39_06510 [Chloroflexi bacterium]|nr:hypothetical protein [Chloroflexota bacterium]